MVKKAMLRKESVYSQPACFSIPQYRQISRVEDAPPPYPASPHGDKQLEDRAGSAVVQQQRDERVAHGTQPPLLKVA